MDSRHSILQTGTSPAGVLLAGLLLVAGWTALAPGARGETITWDNPAGGSWNTSTNWDPNDVPNEPGEDALFLTGDGAYTVQLTSGISLDAVVADNEDLVLDLHGQSFSFYTGGGLTNSGTILVDYGSPGIYGNILNRAAGELRIAGGRVLYLGGLDVTNHGAILINFDQTSPNAVLYANSSDTVVIGGTGEIRLLTAGDTGDATLGTYSGYLLQAAGHTIAGEGRITAYMINEGLISADVADRTLLLSTGNKENHGTVQATGDGILQITSAAITQGPTGLLLADGGLINPYSASISGGFMNTANGGLIECTGSTHMSDVHSQGDVALRGGQVLYLQGAAFGNDGVLVLNNDQTSSNAVLYCNVLDTLEVGGTGEIVLQATTEDGDAQIGTYTGAYCFGAGQTIRGAGRVSAQLANEGRFNADVPGERLRLATNSKTNRGTLEATNGGILEITGGAVTQSETGVVLADGGVVNLNAGRINGGTLQTVDAGAIQVTGTSYLSDVANLGALDVMEGEVLHLCGSEMANDGTVTINREAGSGDSYLYCNVLDTLQVSGAGEIILQATTEDGDAQIGTYTGAYCFGAGQTIRGAGRVSAQLANEGRFNADVPGERLRLATNSKTNRGTLEATNGGILEITGGAVTQSETGVVLADGGVVNLNAGRINGGTLQTADPGAIQVTGTSYLSDVANLGALDVMEGEVLHLCGSEVRNDGTITVNREAGSGNTVLYCNVADTLRVSGTGEFLLQTAGSPSDASVATYTGTFSFGPGHTIRGEGTVSAQLINEGLILGDQPNATLYLTTNTKVNRGMVAAVDTGIVEVQTGSFYNEGLCAASGAGLFRATTLAQHYASNTLTGGAWYVHENSTMRLINVDIHTLKGEILLDGPESWIYRDNATTDALANLSEVGLGGRLQVANGRDLGLTQGLTVDFGGVVIGSGCVFSVDGEYLQYGADLQPYVPSGYTHVDGTLTPSSGQVTVYGGLLSGSGTVEADVVNGGRVDPGTPTGLLTIQGAYTQADSGALTVELAAGAHDHLHVTGDASLAGKIWVRSLGGYEPAVGDTFQVLSCAARGGEFTESWGCPGVGLDFGVHYHPDRVVIEIYAAPSDVAEAEDPEEGIDPNDAPTPDPGIDGAVEPLPSALSFAARPAVGGTAVMSLGLPHAARVDISVYDFTGRHVATLVSGAVPAGRHQVHWDGRGAGGPWLGSGIYFARARIVGGRGVQVRAARVMLIR